jgi:hypothetical protein
MRIPLLARCAALGVTAALAVTGVVAATGGSPATDSSAVTSSTASRMPTTLSVKDPRDPFFKGREQAYMMRHRFGRHRVAFIIGVLQSGRMRLRGKRVFLERRSHLGQHMFFVVRRERTNHRGVVFFVVRRGFPSRYRLVFFGTMRFAPSHSRIILVR